MVGSINEYHSEQEFSSPDVNKFGVRKEAMHATLCVLFDKNEWGNDRSLRGITYIVNDKIKEKYILLSDKEKKRIPLDDFERTERSYYSLPGEGVFLYDWDDQKGKSGGYYFDKAVPIDDEGEPLVDRSFLDVYKNNEYLKKLIDKSSTIIEPGSGGQGMIFKTFSKESGYDLSKKIVKVAEISHHHCKNFEKIAKQLVYYAEAIPKSFHESKFFEKNDGLVFFGGGTIGNMTMREGSDLIRTFGSGENDRDMVIEYFSAPEGPNKKKDIQNIESMYSTQGCKEFILRGMHAHGVPIYKDDGEMDADQFEYVATYVESPDDAIPDMMKMGVLLKKDLTFSVDGITYSRKKGEYIRGISSRRYTSAQFEKMAEDGGTTVEYTSESDDGLKRVAVLKKKGRSLLEKSIKYIKKYRNAIGLVLLLGGSISAGTMYGKYLSDTEKSEIHSKSLESILYSRNPGTYSQSNEMEKKIEIFLEKTEDVFELLTSRYSNDLTKDQKQKIMIDFAIYHTENGISYNRLRGSQGYLYDSGLLRPNDFHSFITANRERLKGYGVNTVPNKRVFGNLTYRRALLNSYEYPGPQKKFSIEDVTIVGSYVKNTVSWTFDEGKRTPQSWIQKVGLVDIEGTDYLVFGLGEGDSQYILDPKNDDLYAKSYTSHGEVCDLLGKDDIQIVAETVRSFLIDKYGDGSRKRLGGEKPIVDILTRLYAEGFDFSYLTRYKYSEYNTYSDRFEKFVFSYILSEVWGDLLYTDSLPSTDFRSIIDNMFAISSDVDLKKRVSDIIEYVKKYTGQEQGTEFGKELESDVLRVLFSEGVREKLDSVELMRCWIVDHKDLFEKYAYTIFSPLEFEQKKPGMLSELLSSHEESVPIKRITFIGEYEYVDRHGTSFFLGTTKQPNNQKKRTGSMRVEGFSSHKEYLDAKKEYYYKIKGIPLQKALDSHSILHWTVHNDFHQFIRSPYNGLTTKQSLRLRINEIYNITNKRNNHILEDIESFKKDRKRYKKL